MQTISSAELRSAIGTSRFSIVRAHTQLGHFPELVVMNGRTEIVRIGCLAYESPRASSH